MGQNINSQDESDATENDMTSNIFFQGKQIGPFTGSDEDIYEYIMNHEDIDTKAREDRKSMVNIVTSETFKTDAPFLYMAQKEIGHVCNSQYNGKGAILCSDEATTCHVVAFRSETCFEGERKVLASLAHLDGTDYSNCVKYIVREHLGFHQNNYSKTNKLELHVHIVGGFNDKDKTSVGITTWFFRLLQEISLAFRHDLSFVINTCVICGLNETATESGVESSPIVRGLALDANSGVICPLHTVHAALHGPAKLIRRAKLWVTHAPNLVSIHSFGRDRIDIAPYQLKTMKYTDIMLTLSDEVLLKYTSTSPHCEADNYCDSVRSVFTFLRDTKTEDVFEDIQKCLLYCYDESSKNWYEIKE